MARRLAAIMFTDIAGYTSLSQTDEPAALRLLRGQERLVRGLLQVHQGRFVKSMGDGLLIEFPNALDAVECAVDLQRHIQERNAREPPPELRVRIGIHLGDVEGVGPDILGDAVNVASRIEPLAEPGGVCLSEPVYGQVRNKVSFQLEKLGLKTLKGVQEPLEVYRVVVPERAVVGAIPAKAPGPPRLAVLPLANISPDPKDEYFADGLTEELITILSGLSELRVIARTSVMQYKSAPKPVALIGTELGVSSILEGSVRKAGDRLRITVQLIDVGSGEHNWAETYDRNLGDVFAIQADVAQQIAQVLKIKVGSAEKARLEGRPPLRPESYLAYLRGRALFSTAYTPNAESAKKEFELAASVDPNNAAAYSGLADVTHILGERGRLGPGDDWFRQSKQYALRALELDPNLSDAHASLASLIVHAYDYVGAEKEFRQALLLNPSNSFAHLTYGLLLEDRGRVEEAIREFSLAEESDPHSMVPLLKHADLLVRHRRLDQMLPLLDRLGQFKMDVNEVPEFFMMLARYYGARSEFLRAHQELDRANEARPGIWWDDRIFLYVLAGERDKARKLLEDEEQKPEAQDSALTLAWAHGLLGDLDQCFRWLEIALEKHQIVVPRVWLGEPGLEMVRGDSRFTQLWKRINLA